MTQTHQLQFFKKVQTQRVLTHLLNKTLIFYLFIFYFRLLYCKVNLL